MFTREWELGCVHSDIDHPTDIEWVGTNEVRINLAYGDPVDIGLDPVTGRPDAMLSGLYC